MMARPIPFGALIARTVGTLAAIAVAVSTAGAQTMLRDAEIEEFLADYSEPLMEVAGINPDSIDILLINDPSFNAFAGPGIMGMFTGTILLSDAPNEIEGVLAHEVGHLAGAHAVRGPEAFAKASRPALLSLVLGAAAIAAGAPEAGLGIMGLGQNIAIGEALSYSRGQESAADQAALTYLEEIGRSGEGLVRTFEKLSNRQLLSGRRIDPYLQSHPLGARRVAALSDRASAQEHYDDRDSEAEILRLKMIQAKIHGFVNDGQHTLRMYPLSDQSMPARYARAVAYYRMSDLDRATREIDRLIEEDPDNPFFAELKGQMLFEHGQIAESIDPHRRSVELGPEFALLRLNLGRSLVALEKPESVEEGITTLKETLQIERDNSFAWSELARAYALQDRTDLASFAQAQAYYYVGNLPDAHRFATRARDDLEPGTPEHLQTLDIIAASEDEAFKARARSQSRLPR